MGCVSPKTNISKSKKTLPSSNFFTFEWDDQIKKGVVIDQQTINVSNKECSLKYAFSKTSIPNQPFFFEIQILHSKGCLDSIGIAPKSHLTERNGGKNQGLALRLYGQHNQEQFYGIWQNEQFTNFFNEVSMQIQFLPQDIITFYVKNTCCYLFKNQRYLGNYQSDENLENLYICVELCHTGGFKVMKETTTQIEMLENQIQIYQSHEKEVNVWVGSGLHQSLIEDLN